jgi:MoxR-like ATPase
MKVSSHLLVLQLAMQAHQPIFLWGAPGTGKTRSVEAIARALKLPIWTIALSTREPTDQAGLPVVTEKGVRMHPPLWAAECIEQGGGAVFFDELNTAPATVQASALRVVQDGYVGDVKLPAETSFIAAGNPASTSTGVYQLTAATANRWVHLDWRSDPEEYFDGMLGGWPEPEVAKLPANWRDLVQTKRALIVSFLRRRPDLIDAEPQERSAQGRAWPSKRTWDVAARMLAAAAAVGHNERSLVGKLMLAGCVGGSAESEFSQWVVNLDLRDPEEYLADPINTPLPDRQDQIMATLDGIASAASDRSPRFDEEERLKRVYAAFKVLVRVPIDLTVPAARALVTNAPNDLWNRPPDELKVIGAALKRANFDYKAQ